MSLDLTTFDAALKQHYTSDTVQNMVYKDNPFLALVTKYEDFGGRNLPIPLIFGNPQGRSANFNRAQTRGAITNTLVTDFVLTRVKDYSIATIDNETIEASKGRANAFLEAATVEIDGAINSLTRSLAVALYGSGFGDIGRLSTTVAVAGATTITLNNPNDVTNFEVGQELVVAAAANSGALRALGSSGNGLIITGIDRSTGVLTFGFAIDDATNGVPTIATGDFLFVRGDRQDAVSPVALKVSGLSAWVPSTSPSATQFFSVDRTADVTRLAGVRYNAGGAPIEEAVVELASRIGREGGKPDTLFLDFAKFAELEKALGAKVQYVDLKVNPVVGFRGITIHGPRGDITVVPDMNCPSDRAFMVQKNTWKLYSLGKAVRVIDTDGLQMLRQASSDGVEVRYGFYGNLGCNAPGYNGVITW